MPRPFRFRPPSLPVPVVARPRLTALVAQRWERRVVTVVAGPGFGKTALLAAAGPSGLGGRDVWLTCEPEDQGADHLVSGLAESLGLSPHGGLDDVLDTVWACAPEAVCLVLDDVHEIPPGSEGAAVLSRLVADLAANGHLVLLSRDAVPVSLARVAASGQLVRLTEADLLFEEAELAAFAASRRVDPALLASTGGWPALAELTASAGADLVPEYLWQEFLAGLGDERAALLARFAAVGGGDDAIATAIAGRPCTVDEIVRAVPLVQRSAEGWASLHPLWGPALRPLVAGEDAAAIRRTVAAAHRRDGRYRFAAELLVEAEAWPELLATILDADAHGPPTLSAALRTSEVSQPLLAADFRRWYRALPPAWRGEPEALLALGLDLMGRAPLDAAAPLAASAAAFRGRGDVDGELAAVFHEGLVRWWIGDFAGLLALHGRAAELAAAGSARARILDAVAKAALAHLLGDSAGVLAATAGIHGEAQGWLASIRWLRSVAHRRNGDLASAFDELDRAAEEFAPDDPQHIMATARTRWLEGEVDRVLEGVAHVHTRYSAAHHAFLRREAALELAAKSAWLGDVPAARVLLAEASTVLADAPNTVAAVLEAIARAAVAIAEGDEGGAAALLTAEMDSGPAALGTPAGWLWRDRAAIALLYLLVPATRHQWGGEALGAAHRPGLALGEALAAARNGDLGPAGTLRWPGVGVVRAHLPARWVAELAAAGAAAGNAPPEELVHAAGPSAGTALHDVAAGHPVAAVAAAAKELARAIPARPSFRLRVGVLGPLQLWRDGVPVEHPDLRRARVRELLCYLAAVRRGRREAIGEELWPEAGDPAHNLSVTLNYVQRVLQPDRSRIEPPYFVRTTGDWLELGGVEAFEVDAWELESLLDAAEAADRASSPAAALEGYGAALPLWQGEPFADAPFAAWAEPPRARLRARFVAAATRAGELSLAARSADGARRAAEAALAADPASEPAYRLLARSCLGAGDRSGARAALDRCVHALDSLGVAPDPATSTLLASLGVPTAPNGG